MSPVIQVKGLAKSFVLGGKTVEVLHSIDLRVREGESISITGESGSGKTTLLNILAGLEMADSGSVWWREKEIRKMSPSQRAVIRAGTIGMVFQAYYLIPEIDALDNVILASHIAGRLGDSEKRRARELMARVGLTERLHSSPLNLSGGERQRVALARALMNRPDVILADEPTGNLDEQTGISVIDLLLEICSAEESSLVLVTHNRRFADRTDRGMILRNGVLEKNV